MTNGNEPAFARPASEYTASGTLPDGNNAVRENDGLTKREHFAAMALQGIIASGEADHYDDVCFDAARYADALIDALNKKPESQWRDSRAEAKRVRSIHIQTNTSYANNCSALQQDDTRPGCADRAGGADCPHAEGEAMSSEQAVLALEAVAKQYGKDGEDDPEQAHIQADEILFAWLEDFAPPSLVFAYKTVKSQCSGWWYS